jgi:hypothetical protein
MIWVRLCLADDAANAGYWAQESCVDDDVDACDLALRRLSLDRREDIRTPRGPLPRSRAAIRHLVAEVFNGHNPDAIDDLPPKESPLHIT